MAIGVVFVLLIGEIDLSIGYVSGLSAVVVAELQLSGSSHESPWYIAIAGALGSWAPSSARIQGSFIASWVCRRSSSRWLACWPGTA